MRLASPKYFCTNSEPTTRMKLAVVELATALTSMVFPVPTRLDICQSYDPIDFDLDGVGLTGRTVQQYTSRRIDPDLPIQIKL